MARGRRSNDDDEDGGGGGGGGDSREPRLVEGSGHIADDDDEEIDEDGAFNSDDEVMYGDLFPSSKSKKTSKGSGKKGGRKGGGGGDDDDESDDESVDDDDGSGGDSDSDDGSENDWAGSSSDDEEGEEDDGGQYMLDLLDNLDKQVTTTTPSEKKTSSGEKKGKGEGGRIALGSAATEAAARLPEGQFRAGALAAMSSGPSTDGGDGGGGGGGKLTLDSLMGGISDTAGFASVQRSMRALSSGIGGGGSLAKPSPNVEDDDDDEPSQRKKKLVTTAVPVSRTVSDRASRRVHYEASADDVGRWQDAVHEQRDAETLDFRTNKGGLATNRISRDDLVDKFEASNDFERELQDALEKAGMEDERAMERRERRKLTGDAGDAPGEGGDEANGAAGDGVGEEDDLGSARITLAEYRKRHAELAKLRALMFYEEQKRHRINKIKSKKYRKIRKRKSERLKGAEDEAARLDDPDGAIDRERMEQEEMDRMRERMTLAHKNTSKWARRVLRRGAKMDVEERKALSLQIARGEELRRKVNGEGPDDGGSDSEGETEEGLLKRARDILMEDDDDGGDGEGKKKGLFQLEFMKRGMEAQRARAKEEARRLLEELEANERVAAESSDDDEEDGDDFDLEERKSSNGKKKRGATEAETAQVLPEGKLVASSLKFGKADGFAISVDGNIELNGKGGDRGKNDEAWEEEEEDEGRQGEASGASKGGKKKRRKKKKKGKDDDGDCDAATEPPTGANGASPEQEQEGEEENPWIASKSGRKTNRPLSRTVNIDEAASMLVDAAQDDGGREKRKRESKIEQGLGNGKDETALPPGPDDKDGDVGIADLSQAELVRRAFAAPADLEAEEEFEKEKERMKERDDPTRKKKEDAFVSGWGSWAGAGARPPKKPRKLPPKLSAPIKKKVEDTTRRKDDGRSTVIINEKRAKKTADKFQLSEVPYPYRSREEYERSIAGSVGQEWNTIAGAKEMSRPAVLVRAGKIVQPIAKKAKMEKRAKKRSLSRAPAKF